MDFFGHRDCKHQNSSCPSIFFLGLDFPKLPMHLVYGNQETDFHFCNPNKGALIGYQPSKSLLGKILPDLWNTQK